MDLALALGYRTVDAMLRTMTALELGQWETYARRFRLPQQRTELALANIARMWGGGDIVDYLFDPRMRERLTPKVAPELQTAANAVAGMFGGARIVHLGAVPIGMERKAANG